MNEPRSVLTVAALAAAVVAFVGTVIDSTLLAVTGFLVFAASFFIRGWIQTRESGGDVRRYLVKAGVLLIAGFLLGFLLSQLVN